MKKNKALFMWGAVALVAFAAVVFDFQWQKLQEEKKLVQTKIFAVDSAQISAFEMTGGASTVDRGSGPVLSNRIRVEKTGEGWMIKSPVEERASQDETQSFVEGLAQERGSEVILDAAANEGSVNWAQFGLDAPLGSITIFDLTGQSSTVSIGSRKNFQGDAYLRRGEENRVMLGTNSWFTRAERKLLDFRDKRILREASMRIQKVRFTSAAKSVGFELQDSRWVYSEAPKIKMDQEKLREILSALVSPSVIEFKLEGEASARELKALGFAANATRIDVELDGGEKWNAEISSLQDENYHLKISKPPMVVVVPATEVTRFLSVDPEVLRDRKEPFDFDKNRAAEFEIKNAKSLWHAKKVGEAWQVQDDSTDKTALSTESLSTLLENLHELEVSEFIDTQKTPVPAPGKTEIKISDAKGEVLLHLKFGDWHKRKISGQTKWRMLAASNLFAEVVSVDQPKMDTLGLAAWLPEPPAKAKPNSAAEADKSSSLSDVKPLAGSGSLETPMAKHPPGKPAAALKTDSHGKAGTD